MTTDEMIALLQTARAPLDALLADMPEAWMTEPGVDGVWSVKDVVAHLSYHERWFADRLHEQLRGEPYQPTEMDVMDFDARNALLFAKNQPRPLGDILAESREGFARLLTGIAAHPPAFLLEPQHFEGIPQPVAIWPLLQSNIGDHYAEHLPTLQAWWEARRAGETGGDSSPAPTP